MLDILLDSEDDIAITANGDISLTDSVRQAVLVRLRWILEEWRFAPSYGFPWFEEMLQKNPDLQRLKRLVRNEVMSVDEVTECSVTDIRYDPKQRMAVFRFQFSVGEETYKEELEIHV